MKANIPKIKEIIQNFLFLVHNQLSDVQSVNNIGGERAIRGRWNLLQSSLWWELFRTRLTQELFSVKINTRDGRGGAFPRGGGRGGDENLRGGAKVKIRGAGRGGAKERVNWLIQKFDNSAYIVMEIFVVYYDVLIN